MKAPVAAVLHSRRALGARTKSRRARWQTYREAQATFDKIIPGKTTAAELRELALDPERWDRCSRSALG